ncbi:SRPBCC domain-containing protein [Nocardia carnea]|uniref:SRPBCC domain-containing protein n=1 Tax=Nocardia carnea TaxID=37328 RepID=UPI003D7AD921
MRRCGLLTCRASAGSAMLAHPPAKVWRALTESEHLRHWFPADILGERRAGAEVRFRLWPESVEQAAGELRHTRPAWCGGHCRRLPRLPRRARGIARR